MAQRGRGKEDEGVKPLKIDRDVPPPIRAHTILTETLRRLKKPRDSFLVPRGVTQPAVHALAKRHGLRITTKRDGDTYRVWLALNGNGNGWR
jgi:hypothetical protein